MPKTGAKRQASYRARLRERGLVPRTVWAHPDDWPQLLRLALDLSRSRKREG